MIELSQDNAKNAINRNTENRDKIEFQILR